MWAYDRTQFANKGKLQVTEYVMPEVPELIITFDSVKTDLGPIRRLSNVSRHRLGRHNRLGATNYPSPSLRMLPRDGQSLSLSCTAPTYPPRTNRLGLLAANGWLPTPKLRERPSLLLL